MYKVFLLDDEELIVKQISSTVSWMDNGFEVAGVETDPLKAIERIMDVRPDVVFSDLKMPVMDGHDVMKAIRSQGLGTEFVMLSAYGTFDDAKTFFKQDGFDYLLKPIDHDEVQLVLEKLAQKLNRRDPTMQLAKEEISCPAFNELMDYVKEHYEEKLTLNELGKMFGLSAGYICNLFAKHYNTTLTCYITNIRMDNAVALMRDSNTSLKNIAIKCGYKDYFYFNKVFKAHFGMAPSQYMKEML